MIRQTVTNKATRLFSSCLRRKPALLLLWGCCILQSPHGTAQTTIITGAQIRNPITPVAALPTTCKPYSTYFLTTTNTAYICTDTNILMPLTGSGGGLPPMAGTPGYL